MENKKHDQRKRVRVNGQLHEVVVTEDAHGVLTKFLKPLRIEFRAHDFFQVVVGSMLLAIPVGFTQEVWELGETLSIGHFIGLTTLAFAFTGSFIYYMSYKGKSGGHETEYVKRTLTTMLMAFVVGGVFLTMIDKAPWMTDTMLAVKRSILIAFPASLSGAVADMID